MSEHANSNYTVGMAGRSEHLASPAVMPELSLPRLYALRAAYLFMSVGLGVFIWPILISHTSELANTQGARYALLAGIGVMAALGLKYPIQMLPILLFELTWKAIYLAAFALPLWSAHEISAATSTNIRDVFWGGVIVIALVPWRYVFARYVLRSGDRWK